MSMHKLAYMLNSNILLHQTKLEICNFSQVVGSKLHYTRNHLSQQVLHQNSNSNNTQNLVGGDKLISTLLWCPKLIT